MSDPIDKIRERANDPRRHDAELFRADIQTLLERIKNHESDILCLRNDYSQFSSRACPACLYEDGKFIKLCKLHERISDNEARITVLEKLEKSVMDLSHPNFKELKSKLTSAESLIKNLNAVFHEIGNLVILERFNRIEDRANFAIKTIEGFYDQPDKC